jgi:hypothetical protein
MRTGQRVLRLRSAQAATMRRALKTCSAGNAARGWFADLCTASAVETPLTLTSGSATDVVYLWGDLGACREEVKL